MALKEIFPNEDATRFDLVEELYSLPQKPPATMHTFAAWLEEWVTKLVAADEISAYVEPRRAMAVLSHVGKPPSSIGHLVHDGVGCHLSRIRS